MRRLFTLAAGLSLLLFLATAVLWVRSYQFSDAVLWVSPLSRDGTRIRDFSVTSQLGKVWIDGGCREFQPGHAAAVRASDEVPKPVLAFFAERMTEEYRRSFAGYGPMSFEIAHPYEPEQFPLPPYQSRNMARETVVPDWALVVAAAIAPAIWTHRRLRLSKARRSGHCPRCGYDLRATPDRCPECGHMPEKARESA